MRTSVLIFVLACGIIAGAIVYLQNSKPAPASPPVVAVSFSTTTANPEPATNPPPETRVALPPAARAPAPSATLAAGEVKTNAPESPIAKSVDALLAAKSGAEKHALFQQLAQAGQLDPVIAELQQRAAANPSDPEIPTTIGEALLNKIKATMAANGGQPSDDIGIMAMQADQQFNAALKIDPQNWEAQFVKASSMSYWPADPQRDGQVVQQLSSLIDQQESLPSQAEFAQPYVVLGNEYQKIGQPDKALATWQLGLSKFPNDPTLQQKVGGGN